MLHLEVITSKGCGCCKDFIGALTMYKNKISDIEFEMSDISQHKDIEIKGVPYTIVMKDGQQVGEIVGNMRFEILVKELERYSK